MSQPETEYILTIVQHTYCNDCMWLKGKITDVYHASGIIRGDDSQNWRMHIISPPWDRARRKAEFPKGFSDIDVPALKLEVGNQIAFATQNPALINEILEKLKWLLIKRQANAEIMTQLKDVIRDFKETSEPDVCIVAR